MSSLAVKIISGTLALGSIGTATYFGGKELLRSATIKEKLISENFKFIGVADSEQWNAEFDSDQEAIKLALGNSISSGGKLKEWCQSKLNVSIDNAKDLKNFKNWCGIRDISSQLKRKKQTILVGLIGSDVEQKWNATITKRKSKTSERSKVGLTGNWGSDINSETPKVKAWCKENSKIDFLVKQDIYKFVEGWCTEGGKSIEEF